MSAEEKLILIQELTRVFQWRRDYWILCIRLIEVITYDHTIGIDVTMKEYPELRRHFPFMHIIWNFAEVYPDPKTIDLNTFLNLS